MISKSSGVVSFREINKTSIDIAGGKGANLGELSMIEGIHIPDGFCVTTEVFKSLLENSPAIITLLDQLSYLKAEGRNKISELGTEIRHAIDSASIPADVADLVADHLKLFGKQDAYAVRSSGTAEDLPSASFAGQQDSYLNIIGKEAILKHISKCWASLFTDRAITYRIQNGFDHRKVHLAVVVQKMVFPQVAGILFTADPVTGNRKITSIDASFGLGEALVSGLVNADVYKVTEGEIIDKKIAVKKLAVYASKDGSTEKQETEPGQQNIQALTDEQALELERIGRKIETHFGQPQDIEWCLADGTFYIVQSRPITTLFPAPEANDHEKHVYLSVGHQQMMTDAMRPLGISLHQLVAARPMYKAAGRLFVDITENLTSPAGQQALLKMAEQHDPLIKDALATIIDRGYIESTDDESKPAPRLLPKGEIENDPSIVRDLMNKTEASIQQLKQRIEGKSGAELFDFIQEDIKELKSILFDPKSSAVFMAAINASQWLNEKMNEWLGEKNAADTLSQSVPNNITSEMGLALLDVADVIRPYPEVIEYLQQTKDVNYLNKMQDLHGGAEARNAIVNYLDKYGMRCVGEIDITNPRWSEQPATIIPLILNNIRNSEPGAGAGKFEQGRQEAMKKEQELLERLRQLPDGEQKVKETKQKISLLRNFIGYREYPKYGKIARYRVYKQAIMQEAERLVQASTIHEKEDIFYLTFEELHEVARTHKLDQQLISKRKEEQRHFERLTPPRVITSDGEAITGSYNLENIPDGALAGLAVSSGLIEGRARVILKMEDAVLEDDDILVTTFTDPSWTPLFVSVKGLVTEIGGLMTHGAVIAREYGLPAVVGVEHATALIQDGQRIRVNGTDGYVELL